MSTTMINNNTNSPTENLLTERKEERVDGDTDFAIMCAFKKLDENIYPDLLHNIKKYVKGTLADVCNESTKQDSWSLGYDVIGTLLDSVNLNKTEQVTLLSKILSKLTLYKPEDYERIMDMYVDDDDVNNPWIHILRDYSDFNISNNEDIDIYIISEKDDLDFARHKSVIRRRFNAPDAPLYYIYDIDGEQYMTCCNYLFL